MCCAESKMESGVLQNGTSIRKIGKPERRKYLDDSLLLRAHRSQYRFLHSCPQSLVAYKKALKRKPDHPQILLKVEGVESLLRGKNISNSQLANPTAPPLDSPQFTSVEELLVNCFWVRNYQKNHHMTTRATIASFFVFCKLIVKSKSLAFPADQLRWRLLCDIVTKEITKKIISFLEVLQFGFAMTLCFTWHDLIYGPAWIKNEEKMLFRLIRNETWAHLLTREDCFEDIGGVVLWREFDLNCRSADDAKTVSQ